MINNFNGNLVEETNLISINNRGYTYGDALFETIRVAEGNILFWEDHYFRLMASMRIMRMEIPMEFTMEFLENQIFKTLEANNLQSLSARVKLLVHRNEGGLYLPNNNAVSFVILVNHLGQFYTIKEEEYEVDLFKDYFVAPGLLSTLKTNNKALHVVGSIYAKENKLQNCLILNTEKQVVEALNGNVFLVKGSIIKTPPILDGCLKGIMRKQIIGIIKNIPEFTLEEASISPFELQQADELFITNVIVGIQPITQYRKKTFKNSVSTLLLERLNESIKMG
jgi:branched-chain amino acid aminotransferase